MLPVQGVAEVLCFALLAPVNFTITFHFSHLSPCLFQPTVVTFGTYFGRYYPSLLSECLFNLSAFI